MRDMIMKWLTSSLANARCGTPCGRSHLTAPRCFADASSERTRGLFPNARCSRIAAIVSGKFLARLRLICLVALFASIPVIQACDTANRVVDLAVCPDKQLVAYVLEKNRDDSRGAAMLCVESFGRSGPKDKANRRWSFWPARDEGLFAAFHTSYPPSSELLFGGILLEHDERRSQRKPGIISFDPGTMTCRTVASADDTLVHMGEFNIVNGRFPAIRVEPKRAMETAGEKGWDEVIVSLQDGRIEGVPREAIGMPSFLLSNGHFVSQWGALTELKRYGGWERHSNLLLDNGTAVDESVDELIGITPDTQHVFFTKLEAVNGATASTLWTYNPESGSTKRIGDFVGQRLRVSADSRRYGFLVVSEKRVPGVKRWPGIVNFRGRHPVLHRARIFDIEGNRLQEFAFEHPIEARVWDWDIDAEILAYYNETGHRIVVQRLNGEVLSVLKP